MPSHSAADDFDGSKLAGFDKHVCDCGAHPAPMEEAMSEGTIVMREGLKEGMNKSQEPGNVGDETR